MQLWSTTSCLCRYTDICICALFCVDKAPKTINKYTINRFEKKISAEKKSFKNQPYKIPSNGRLTNIYKKTKFTFDYEYFNLARKRNGRQTNTKFNTTVLEYITTEGILLTSNFEENI